MTFLIFQKERVHYVSMILEWKQDLLKAAWGILHMILGVH